MDPANGMRLHHVGYAVKLIQPAAQSYIERYGYELSTSIIHDPLQTAFVQFLRLAGDQNVPRVRRARRSGEQADQRCQTRWWIKSPLLYLRAARACHR